MGVLAEHSSPLEFWKESGREFPLLTEVARRILCSLHLSQLCPVGERLLSGQPYQPFVQRCRLKQ